MAISIDILNRLHLGKEAAAEVPDAPPHMRAYVVVIPQVPDSHEQPELWQRARTGEMVLHDAASIIGYEIRYLLHHEKYTETDWGWDWDYVLDDETTRVKRVFVTQESEIEAVVRALGGESSALRDPDIFDSSLVHGLLDYYLNRPAERPHLWR